MIKCLNFRLHLMFDGEEVLSEDDQHGQTEEQNTERRDSNRGNLKLEVSNDQNDEGIEAIQLEVIRRSSDAEVNKGHRDNVTQPRSTSLIPNSSDSPSTEPNQV